MTPFADRVGLGWRPGLAAGIFSHLDQIDVLEVILEDFSGAPARSISALQTLQAQIPVLFHGVSLGPASAHPVETKRLEKIARLMEKARPESWSEHLAFVRAGGREIGHLAAPPRTEATIEGATNNLKLTRSIVGALPEVENIATLIDPPGSSMDETRWTTSILGSSGCRLLLDLHNLHANSVNFSFDPLSFIRGMPKDAIATIHLAGGKWITYEAAGSSTRRRLLDDHLHDVPDPVFDLLAEVAAIAPNPLTVVIERDGLFPSMRQLLKEIGRAREALARGRARFLREDSVELQRV